MTERSESNEQIDRIGELLPWFVMGTLDAQEHRAVEQHLPGCERCRIELEEIRSFKNDLHSSYSSLHGLSPDSLTRVKARIKQKEIAARQKDVSRSVPMGGNWIASVETGFRSLFAPRWVPAVAVLLIVSQTTFLMWERKDDQQGVLTEVPDIITGPITEREIPPIAPPSSFSVIIELAFQEGISEQELRSVIHGLGGRIVDGPSIEGVYVVEGTTSDMELFNAQVEQLRGQTDIVRLVKRLDP